MKQTPNTILLSGCSSTIINFALLVAVIISFTSCATIFTGTRQKVTITSPTPKAKVQVNGIDRGNAPLVVRLKRGHTGQIVTVTAEGHESRTFQPETTFNLVGLGNIIFPPAFAFDMLTGALWRYHPKRYDIQLEKKR